MCNANRVKEEVNFVSVFSKLMNRNLFILWDSLLLLEILTLISCVFVVVLLFLSFLFESFLFGWRC